MRSLTKAAFTAARDINDTPVGLVKSMTYSSTTHIGATKSAYYQIASDYSLKLAAPYAPSPPA